MNTDTEKQITATAYRLALQFRNVEFELLELRKKAFPRGCFVHVDAPSYRGFGIVASADGQRADQVAVTLENGNTWWYPIEGVQRVTDLQAVPRVYRQMKLRSKGVNSLVSWRTPALP